MSLIVYGMDLSPPTRAVLLTIKSLGIPFVFKKVDLLAGEHMNPDFLKLNPLHTVPTIDDNGTVLYDSNAINPYLVGKYGKNDALYPKDLAKRAVVDQRLHFQTFYLFVLMRDIVRGHIMGGDGIIPDDLKQSTENVYKELERLLGDHDWIAHTPSYTIADLSLLCTIESFEAIYSCIEKTPTLVAWRKRAHAMIPGYTEVASKGDVEFKEVVCSLIKG